MNIKQASIARYLNNTYKSLVLGNDQYITTTFDSIRKVRPLLSLLPRAGTVAAVPYSLTQGLVIKCSMTDIVMNARFW